METERNKKTRLWGIAIFAINAIVIVALAFLMLEINRGWKGVDFIVKNPSRAVFVVASVILLLALTYGYLYFESKKILFNLLKLVEMFILLEVAMLFSFMLGKYININARPCAFFAIMCATLLGRRQAMFLNIIATLLIFIIDININLSELISAEMWTICASMLMSFCSGTLVIFVSHMIKTRLQSLLLVILLLIPIELIIGIMEILFTSDVKADAIQLGYGALGAFFSTLLFIIVLPLFELLFSEMTTFRLREVTATSAPLLKRLKTEAPGTFNHSMVVAQLAEACALDIGEDSELTRACAYYHDVGKLMNPEMFTENQSDYNMHNELAPELSTDIIRAHTRDGAKLIKKYHLPDFFADVAVQHHGTLPIKYFYAKALKMSDGEINIANYSYHGPVPQSRIAAIIMIVDAAEAATRSLTDRSTASIEKLVGSIIEERVNLDQFVDCNITMRDLTVITHTIAQSLSGVYHSRISYPKLKIGKKN